MTAAPEYLYGDFKIRRQCAFVEDPEALKREVDAQGANHPLFWVRTGRGRGWHCYLSAWVEGLPDPVHTYKVVRYDLGARFIVSASDLMGFESIGAYERLLKEIAFALDRQAAAGAS